MDFMNPLIIIVGFGSAAGIAIVLVYGFALACGAARDRLGHRHHGHHAH